MNLYCEPLYAAFGDVFYLPFWVLAGHDALGDLILAFLVIGIAWPVKWKGEKRGVRDFARVIIFFAGFIVMFTITVFIYREDVKDINAARYETRFVTVDEITRGRHSDGGSKKPLYGMTYRLRDYSNAEVGIFKTDVIEYRALCEIRDGLRAKFIRENGLDAAFMELPYDAFCQTIEDLRREDGMFFGTIWRELLLENRAEIYYLPHSRIILKIASADRMARF
ncbi:MAG: hypothetical protein LBT26_02100 [Clostridiales Family XIII bacterium]|nr:hypothetical protein [Clostridiales Family XIII bacterium]